MLINPMRSLSRRLPSPNCVLITGAGWSYAAGLPLANELFDPADEVPPRDWSDRAVIDAYEHWRRENVGHPAEQFIACAYEGHAKFMEAPLFPKPSRSRTGQLELALDLEDEQWHERRVGWSQVAAYIQRRLAEPAARTRLYRHNPYRPALLRRTISPAQADFWNALLERTTVRAIVTLNYDLTIEQTVGMVPNLVAGSPGFHYAGIDAKVRPVRSPYARDRGVDPTPAGVIPLAKLHGSLNWSLSADGIDVFADVRPAFRDYIGAAIVPPLPEKHVPGWLWSVWDRAAKELHEADEWVVVGYSLPPYDHEIKAMLRASASRVASIRIYDPFAADLAERWHAIAPDASIEIFPGLEPGFYGRGAASGRLGRDEREWRRRRALRDPRVRSMAPRTDRVPAVASMRIAA
jgi:hypothetical protein